MAVGSVEASMLDQFAPGSALAALMGQVAPGLFSQAASPQGPVPPMRHYPPGLSRWDPELGDQKPLDAQHVWTGNYVATFLVASATPSDAQSVLRKGMALDPEFIKDGSYPVVLGFGTFENARSSRYPFLGLNYSEFLAAIPRVFMPSAKYRYQGPYLYPYRLYLNRLMPTIFGRLSGYPKNWERVSLTLAPKSADTYVFSVGKLLSGKSLLQLSFTVSEAFHRVRHFPRFNQISQLLIPNIIASGFFNIPIRTFFDLDVSNAVAWNVPTATLRVDDQSLFPVLPGTHNWKGIEQELYGGIRLYLPWRLTSVDDPQVEVPWALPQAVDSGEDDQQGIAAAS
jgi:hypothetical protein